VRGRGFGGSEYPYPYPYPSYPWLKPLGFFKPLLITTRFCKPKHPPPSGLRNWALRCSVSQSRAFLPLFLQVQAHGWSVPHHQTFLPSFLQAQAPTAPGFAKSCTWVLSFAKPSLPALVSASPSTRRPQIEHSGAQFCLVALVSYKPTPPLPRFWQIEPTVFQSQCCPRFYMPACISLLPVFSITYSIY